MLQGSFWTAFGARFGTSASSGLDEILERDHFELEDLLDHDDVIQECKYMNAQLIEFLSTKSSIEKLVRYVITLPGDDDGIAQEQKDEPMPSAAAVSTTAAISASASSASSGSSSSSADTAIPMDMEPVPESHSLQPIPEDSTTAPRDGSASSSSSSLFSASKSPQDAEDGETKEEDKTTSGSSSSSSSSALPSSPSDPRSRPNYHKYPYVASELFACEVVSMLDVLFEHPALLQLLFSFLDHPPPMDPSHASYFRKVMVVLIQRKYEALVRYIQSHGIIDKLVQHIGLYSVMEILIMIGWDDGLGQVNDVEWLYRENLIPKLVAKLTPDYELQTDVHMNAARALVDVVVKCLPSAANLLISHLQSSEVLSVIFNHMFSGSLSSLTNSMSIIIVLVQRYANKRVESADDKQAAADTDSQQQHAKAENHTDGAADDGQLEEPFASLSPHLHKIIALLHQPQPEVKVQFGVSQPFGETRMKVVELTLVLLRSRLPAVDRQLAELRVLSLMLESFFLYPWNNMLHGLVESIVRTVLDSESELLRHSLFVDGELVDRFVAAYERSEREATEGCGYRLGYMGHLLRTSMAIEDVARKSEEHRRQLLQDKADKWTAFVNDQLEKENEKQKVVAPFVGGEEDILDGLQFDLAGMNTDNVSQYLGGERAAPASGGVAGAGSSDGYSFNDGDEEDGSGAAGGSGGIGYDYTHSYTINEPDREYDESQSEADDVWRGSGGSSGSSFASSDDWAQFSTQFAADDQPAATAAGAPQSATAAAAGSKKAAAGGEFDRGGVRNAGGRQIISFDAGGREEEDDAFGNGASSEDPFSAAISKPTEATSGSSASAWPASDFNAEFEADFDADFGSARNANATDSASQQPAASAAAAPHTEASDAQASGASEAIVEDFDAEFPPAQ